LDLARLPYFDARGGRLVLADPALGPAMDFHTHLALAWGPFGGIDLRAAPAETKHYLPAHRPIDFECYINQNLAEEDLAALKKDLTLAGFTRGGMRLTHTMPNLAREMEELGVRASVLLPIEFPRPLSKNAETWLDVTAGRRDFVCFGSVHPLEPRLEARLDRQVRLGARGVKVHPAVQLVPPEHPRAMRLYRACGARRLPVFFHCGPVGIEPALGRRMTQVRRYEGPVAECPETTFVLGHSGALQVELAIALSKKYPNVWLELSSQGQSAVRKIFDETDPDRIVFGSDWPFYHQAIGLTKVFLATEGNDTLRRKVLWENGQRLVHRS
jgi:hypothetical protein